MLGGRHHTRPLQRAGILAGGLTGGGIRDADAMVEFRRIGAREDDEGEHRRHRGHHDGDAGDDGHGPDPRSAVRPVALRRRPASSALQVPRIRRHIRRHDRRGVAEQGHLDVLQGSREIQRGVIAGLGVLRHCLAQCLLDLRRHIRACQRGQRLIDDRAHQLPARGHRIAVLERGTARKHREQRGAEGVDVGRDAAPARFGEHFGRRPRRGVPGGDVGLVYRGGHAEIGQRGLSRGRDQHVARLDVPVDDARTVRGVQGARQLDAQIERLVDVQPPRLHQRLVGAARRVLEHDVVEAVRRDPGAVDRQDVGMRRKPRHAVRLRAEPRTGVLVERRGVDLDRHVAFRRMLAVQVDDGRRPPRPACADRCSRVTPAGVGVFPCIGSSSGLPAPPRREHQAV